MNLQVEKMNRELAAETKLENSVRMEPSDWSSLSKYLASRGHTQEWIEELRIQELESEGLTRSDAQGVYDAERIKNEKIRKN